MSEGILVALQQRNKDLEALEKEKKEKNGMLRVEIKNNKIEIEKKDKQIKILKEKLGLQHNDEKYTNPIEDLRTKGII